MPDEQEERGHMKLWRWCAGAYRRWRTNYAVWRYVHAGPHWGEPTSYEYFLGPCSDADARLRRLLKWEARIPAETMSLLPIEPCPHLPENRPLSEPTEEPDQTVLGLKREIKTLNAVLARKNRELDALHYVWCSGGCDGGAHRFVPGQVTEEVVVTAERNTLRLRSWFENSKLRAKYKAERESAGDTKQTDA